MSVLLLLLVPLSTATPSDGTATAVDSDAPPAEAAPSPGAIPSDVRQAAIDARELPLPERMAAVSATLLGRPYRADPLGEGRGHDPDPLVRYDVFDCLTFVEEVLALSLAGDPDHAAEVRNALRYGANEPTYTSRRHFMELQWIPGNVADGWLVDTTSQYGETVRLEREVTLETWRSWGKRAAFAHTDDELPVGPMHLDVLPLATALEVHDRIRPGSIILTVREDRAAVPIWVTHVGFLVPAERPTMRHATKMAGGLSRDHDFAWYLKHIGGYGPWKTLGIAILEPVEQGPRRTTP